uniref:Chitin-inducible gibberellin-responsive protein 1 n=1 Tax=Anthurium amnicola TaxID=1678845 RepID=A0A1D1Z6Q0_9ARAE
MVSGIYFSCNSSLTTDRSCPQIRIPDSLQILSSIPAVSSNQSERNASHEIGTILADTETDKSATANYPEYDESKEREVQKPRLWLQIPNSHHEFPVAQSPYITIKCQKVNDGTGKCERDTKGVPQGDVKQLLIACSKQLSENNREDFEMLLKETQKFVSIGGEPIQRLGAYLLEGLVARQKASGTTIYHALQSKEPESRDLLSYMKILYDICPCFRFGYMAANGAIAEAVRNEDRVHIIDFQIAQGAQWVSLIQALAARPGGPPHLRITGIGDPISKYGRRNVLNTVGEKLSMLSHKFNIPLEFCPVQVFSGEVTKEMLDIRPGEALAVNFTLHLHHTPDEGVDVNNPRDGLLRMVKGLSPKVTTLVEQESNTNTTPFLMRFTETLDYYSAMFESIDINLPRDSKERIGVEQHCLAKDIVNVIACEGKDRVERHELLGKWKSRLAMAGFKPYPLSSYVNSVIRALLRSYSNNYTLVEKDGTMLLGWKDRNLISASAWH